MRNEWTTIGEVILHLQPRILHDLFSVFAPSLAVKSLLETEMYDRVCTWAVREMANVPSPQLDDLRYVFSSIRVIGCNVCNEIGKQIASQVGAMPRIATDLPMESMTSFNLAAWALLHDVKLWRRLETETFEMQRTPFGYRELQSPPVFTYRLLCPSDFFVLSSDEQRKRIDDFVTWYKNNAWHPRHADDFKFEIDFSEHLHAYTFSCKFSYKGTVSERERIARACDQARVAGTVVQCQRAVEGQEMRRRSLLRRETSPKANPKGAQAVARVPRDGKEVPPVEIDMPHLCLYGITQPQILFESLSRNDLRDGWLSRNLFFISRTRPKPETKPLMRIPNAILAEVLAWKSDGPVETVATSDEAQGVFAAFNDEIYAKMLSADKHGDEANYLYGKALENAKRIALILAVSRRGGFVETALPSNVVGSARGLRLSRSARLFADRMCIEACDATFATNLVGYLIGEVIRVVRENLSESADEKAKKRMLQIIALGGANGVLKGELTRKTQWMRRTFRDEYLNDLLESEEIVSREAPGGSVRYFLREYNP